MSFPKPKRIVDKKLLKELKSRPCVVCGISPTDPHHVKTRGAGGGDTKDNILSLCRRHHQEVHLIGLAAMGLKYIALRNELNKKS